MFTLLTRPRSFLLWAFLLSMLLHLGALLGVLPLDWQEPLESELPPLKVELMRSAPQNTPPPVRRQQARPGVSPVVESAPGREEKPLPATKKIEQVVSPIPPGMSVDANYLFRSISMEFEVYWNGAFESSGEMRYRWEFDGKRYTIERSVHSGGIVLRREHSEGTLGVNGLAPEVYQLKRFRKADEGVEFDWHVGLARLKRGNKLNELVLQPTTQDVVSITHQLYFLRPLQQSNPLYIATTRQIGTYIVELVGEENIELPIGTVRSLHLKYRDFDRGRVELWLDQDRALLPVRIYAEDKDDTFDFRLRAIKAELFPH